STSTRSSAPPTAMTTGWTCCGCTTQGRIRGTAPGAEVRPRTGQSGGLPQFDPVALRIGDPAEPADAVHVLRFRSYVRALGAQLREHRIQVADPEVEHGLLRGGPEVAGLGLERREYRGPGTLLPQAVVVSVQAQAIAVPRA